MVDYFAYDEDKPDTNGDKKRTSIQENNQSRAERLQSRRKTSFCGNGWLTIMDGRANAENTYEVDKFKEVGKHILERGIVIVLENGFLEKAVKRLVEVWTEVVRQTEDKTQQTASIQRKKSYRRISDRRHFSNTNASCTIETLMAVLIENKDEEKKNLGEEENPDWYASSVLDLPPVIGYSKEVAALLRLLLQSKYRTFLLCAPHRDWFFKFLADFQQIRFFAQDFVISEKEKIKDVAKKKEHFHSNIKSVFNQFFMVMEFVSKVNNVFEEQNAEENTLTFNREVKRLGKSFKNRVIGVEVVTKDKLELYQFEAEFNVDILDNTNVVTMQENLVHEIKPDLRGMDRQEEVFLALDDIAGMFVHQSDLQKSSKIMQQIADQDELWKTIRTVVISVINLLLWLTVHTAEDCKNAVHNQTVWGNDITYCYLYPIQDWLFVLGIINLFVAIFSFLANVFDWNIFKFHDQKRKEAQGHSKDNQDDAPHDLFKTPTCLSKCFAKCESMSEKVWRSNPCHVLRTCATPLFMFEFLYLVLACIGLFESSFYCYCFSLILFYTEAGLSLWRAITTQLPLLTTSIFVALSLIYLFATMGYFTETLQGNYNFPDLEDEFFPAFGIHIMNHVDQGLRSAPLFSSDGSDRETISLFTIGIFYHWVLILVLVSIFSGIIIDSFANFRDDREKQESFKKKKCMICGLEKADGIGDQDFNDHLHFRHNPEKYTKLLIHLRFTLDHDVGSATQKVTWFGFDDCSVLRMLQDKTKGNDLAQQSKKSQESKTEEDGENYHADQTETNENMPCYSILPSVSIHTKQCTYPYLHKITKETYEELMKEWLLPSLWDIACPPHAIEFSKKQEKEKMKKKKAEKEKKEKTENVINQLQFELTKLRENSQHVTAAVKELNQKQTETRKKLMAALNKSNTGIKHSIMELKKQ